WRETVERGANLEDEWDERFSAYSAAEPAKAEELNRIVSVSGLPAGWGEKRPVFAPTDKPIATRAASGKTIQWAAAQVPELVGGSADLASSNNTDIKGGGGVAPGDFPGRNLHYGV